MDRRGFLSALIGAAALDPERLLWIPGQKKIFIPAVPPEQEMVVFAYFQPSAHFSTAIYRQQCDASGQPLAGALVELVGREHPGIDMVKLLSVPIGPSPTHWRFWPQFVDA